MKIYSLIEKPNFVLFSLRIIIVILDAWMFYEFIKPFSPSSRGEYVPQGKQYELHLVLGTLILST